MRLRTGPPLKRRRSAQFVIQGGFMRLMLVTILGLTQACVYFSSDSPVVDLIEIDPIVSSEDAENADETSGEGADSDFNEPNELAPTTLSILHVKTYPADDPAKANKVDGLTWDTAYPNLQQALWKSVAGQEIWVAKGFYLPYQIDFDPRWWKPELEDSQEPKSTDGSFKLKSGQKLFGGFKGTEKQREKRQPDVYFTRLSGDLEGDDVFGDFLNNRDDNSVVIVDIKNISEPVTIDGFIIKDSHKGAGLSIETGDVVVRQSTFSNHYSAQISSAAITCSRGNSIFASQVTLEKVTVKKNSGDGALGVFGTICTINIRENSVFSQNNSASGSASSVISMATLTSGDGKELHIENSLFDIYNDDAIIVAII